MPMVCNQSALLSVALLRKYGVPARVANGFHGGGSNIGEVLHAWTEYWDGTKRVEVDMTPTKISKYNKSKKVLNIAKAPIQSTYDINDTRVSNIVDNGNNNSVDIGIDNFDILIQESISGLNNLNDSLKFYINRGSFISAKNYFYLKSTVLGGMGFIEKLDYLKKLVKNSDKVDAKYINEIEKFELLKNKYDVWFKLYDVNSNYFDMKEKVFYNKLEKNFMLRKQNDFKGDLYNKFLDDTNQLNLNKTLQASSNKYDELYNKFKKYNSFKEFYNKEHPFMPISIYLLYPTKTFDEFDTIYPKYKNNIVPTDRLVKKIQEYFDNFGF